MIAFYHHTKERLPRPIRAALTRSVHYAHVLRDALRRNTRGPQMAIYRTYWFVRCCWSVRPTKPSGWAYANLHDLLPNSGAVPIGHEYTVAEINAKAATPSRRSEGIPGFEGLAVNDAVPDPETTLWVLATNERLGRFLADFARTHYSRPTFLELGCGPSHLFRILRREGVTNYIGIDGNPFFLRFNPHLRGHEQHFRVLNLQDEIQLGENGRPLTFDILLCFEVLEHICEERIDAVMATFRNHMHSSSIAFVTASLDEELDVHVLVRSREWWLSRFAEYGMRPYRDADALAATLARYSPHNWGPLSTNILVLEKAD